MMKVTGVSGLIHMEPKHSLYKTCGFLPAIQIREVVVQNLIELKLAYFSAVETKLS